MFGTRTRNRSVYDDDDRRSPSRITQSFHRKPMRAGKPYPPPLQPTESYSQFPSSGRQSWAKFTQIGSGNIHE